MGRFSGPATAVRVACTSRPHLHVDVRTEGEAVSETGWQFTQLVLHPSQLSVLSSSEKLVFLTGPPGTGKSLVLMLKCLGWLCQGKSVQICSTFGGSLAASHMLLKQLQQTAGPAATGRLRLLTFDLKRDDPRTTQTAMTTLLALAQAGNLYLIVDEMSRLVVTTIIMIIIIDSCSKAQFPQNKV